MRASYHIEAPVERVFDFFADPTKGADLLGTEIRELRATEEGTGTLLLPARGHGDQGDHGAPLPVVLGPAATSAAR